MGMESILWASLNKCRKYRLQKKNVGWETNFPAGIFGKNKFSCRFANVAQSGWGARRVLNNYKNIKNVIILLTLINQDGKVELQQMFRYPLTDEASSAIELK